MAFGNNNQNNQGSNNTEPTYYSRLKISHSENGMSVSFSYWRGLLKVSITKYNKNDNKTEELATINFSPNKARLFSECIKQVMGTEENTCYGVDTGIGDSRGFAAIGRETGKPYLFIAKVTSDGTYENSQRFEFNVDYNYYLNVRDLNNLKFQKIYDNSMELRILFDTCSDFARYASGAAAVSVWDVARYENWKNSNMIKAIAENLGVYKNDYKGNNSQKRSNGSFFSGKSEGSSSKNYSQIDDLEDELDS